MECLENLDNDRYLKMITILITIITVIKKNRNKIRIKVLYYNGCCLLFVLGGIDS